MNQKYFIELEEVIFIGRQFLAMKQNFGNLTAEEVEVGKIFSTCEFLITKSFETSQKSLKKSVLEVELPNMDTSLENYGSKFNCQSYFNSVVLPIMEGIDER